MTTGHTGRTLVLVDGLGYELTPQSEDDLVRGLTEIDAAARECGEPVLATVYANATDPVIMIC